MTEDRLASARPPAVAGSFYPADRRRLSELVHELTASAARLEHQAIPDRSLRGLLVPHAGLVYSGRIAAAGWRLLAGIGDEPTIVLLGTNHVAGWLDGVGVWATGAWRTPLGDVDVDEELADAILGLGDPFIADAPAHFGEHSIEVQLPFVQSERPRARIVPLAVSCGTGEAALEAGTELGEFLAGRRAAGQQIVLAISTDMAHYPARAVAEGVTATLLPSILGLDSAALARDEHTVRHAGLAGVVCGMCGIEPAVFGLAAVRALGAVGATRIASGTSADALGPADRTVGYLSVAFVG